MNSYYATIKFTAEWSRKFVLFPNTRVMREGNKLISDFYTKRTDTHQYLNQQSYHPASHIYSIVCGRVLCLCRICFGDMEYQCRIEELKCICLTEATMERGYNKK